MKKRLKRKIVRWLTGIVITFLVTTITSWIFKSDEEKA